MAWAWACVDRLGCGHGSAARQCAHGDTDALEGLRASTDSGSDADSGSEQEPLSLDERTLGEVDVPAFVSRLAEAIPTLEDVLIQVQRPRRSGARVRTALFGHVPEGDYAHRWRWVGDALC